MPELEAEQTDIIAMLVEDVLEYVKSSTHEDVIIHWSMLLVPGLK
jgi:hypothetical protein